MNETANEAHDECLRNDGKMVYMLVKQLKVKEITAAGTRVKDKEGNMLHAKKELIENWKEHCEELFQWKQTGSKRKE